VRIQTVERQYLLIAGQMLLEAPTGFAPIQESGLLLEVKECPKLKAWVRDGKLDSVRLCLLVGVSQLGMLIGIEDAPDFIEAEEAISAIEPRGQLPSCWPLRVRPGSSGSRSQARSALLRRREASRAEPENSPAQYAALHRRSGYDAVALAAVCVA